MYSNENNSQTVSTKKVEKKENFDTNTNIANNKINFSETEESKISIFGDKKQNEENDISTIDKSNKIEHNHSKIQNFNLNNSTINNYVIIDKFPSNKSLFFENKEFEKNIFPQILSPFNYSMPFH